MELWIRSQDKKALIPINKMITSTCEGLFYDGIILGTYRSKERAIEVLDEIQKIFYNNQKFINNVVVYEMPEE